MHRQVWGVVLGVALGGAACSAGGTTPSDGLETGGTTGATGGATSAGASGGTTSTGATGGSVIVPTTGGASSGGSSGGGGEAAATCDGKLTGYIRDFQPETHPDFEPQNAMIAGHIAGKQDIHETGIVAGMVDDAWKPIYAGNPNTGTATTTGQANFDMWFRDTPGKNMGVDYTLEFVDPENDGVFTFDRTGASTNQFFPIDNGDACPAAVKTPCLFGNWPSYPTHNFHMTMELHTNFIYQPGMVFTFVGDDDVWVFMNGVLVVDLGGVHNQLTATVTLADVAGQIGLTAGEAYRLDFFWAERKVVNSNFRIETSLKFLDCGLPPVIR
jgi:fibro-slime domain-containing protein